MLIIELIQDPEYEELPTLRSRSFQFSLFDLTGCVLVTAMVLAPLTAGVSALGEATYRGVIGICGVAVAGGLLRRGSARALRFGFGAGGSIFLLVSGWFQVPGVSGRLDLGRVLQASLAIAFGIFGALLAARLAANEDGAEEPAPSERCSLS
jgi:hypothetical protein